MVRGAVRRFKSSENVQDGDGEESAPVTPSQSQANGRKRASETKDTTAPSKRRKKAVAEANSPANGEAEPSRSRQRKGGRKAMDNEGQPSKRVKKSAAGTEDSDPIDTETADATNAEEKGLIDAPSVNREHLNPDRQGFPEGKFSYTSRGFLPTDYYIKHTSDPNIGETACDGVDGPFGFLSNFATARGKSILFETLGLVFRNAEAGHPYAKTRHTTKHATEKLTGFVVSTSEDGTNYAASSKSLHALIRSNAMRRSAQQVADCGRAFNCYNDRNHPEDKAWYDSWYQSWKEDFAYDNLVEILKAKFSQNWEWRESLMMTYPYNLVKASPKDDLYGIGTSATKAYYGKDQDRGENWLAQALMRVRDRIWEQ